jgi:hypothetical protein
VDDVYRDVVIIVTGLARLLAHGLELASQNLVVGAARRVISVVHRPTRLKLQPYALFNTDSIVENISKDWIRAHRRAVPAYTSQHGACCRNLVLCLQLPNQAKCSFTTTTLQEQLKRMYQWRYVPQVLLYPVCASDPSIQNDV